MSLGREELEKIPPLYRWLLKLFLKFPNPSFPHFVLKRLPGIVGVFWAVGVPILLMMYIFFTVWFVTFLSIHIIFPFNVLLGLSLPTVVFVSFLRIQLERTILWWKSVQSPAKEWNISKVVEEFAELMREQKRR